jgi:hypothetical protein
LFSLLMAKDKNQPALDAIGYVAWHTHCMLVNLLCEGLRQLDPVSDSYH